MDTSVVDARTHFGLVMESTRAGTDKLRHIAILIASVDAATARQLLAHLPAETAAAVRQLAANLGTIDSAERRAVLSEFRRTTTAGSASISSRGDSPPQGRHSRASNVTKESASPDAMESDQHTQRSASDANAEKRAAWTRLGIDALTQFIRGERPAVVAVVISQLPPQTGVALLTRLPPDVSSDILRRLARLREIDPDAMNSIDNYLSHKLSEYQHHVDSERESMRRVNSLLAAAPDDLREQWRKALSAPLETPVQDSERPIRITPLPHMQNRVEPSVAAQEPATVAELFSDAVITTADMRGTQAVADNQKQSTRSRQNKPASQRVREGSLDTDPQILPFPHARRQSRSFENVDHGLVQLEFEKILELPTASLALLLSESDPDSVLLALAGATPDFMKRFASMLDPADAHALQVRLNRIGAVRLSDISEAQRRITENAYALVKGPTRAAA